MWLAKHLKEISGINHFTIYQDIMIERDCSSEYPLMDLIHFSEPTLFVEPKGKYFNGSETSERFDALLYHPRNKYIHNRSDWLVNYANHILYGPKPIVDNYPILVKAYIEEQGRKSVPYDIIELEYPNDPTKLVLKPGKYLLQYIDRNIKLNEEVVELTENGAKD